MTSPCNTPTKTPPTALAQRPPASSRVLCAPSRPRRPCWLAAPGLSSGTPEGRRLYDFTSAFSSPTWATTPRTWHERFAPHGLAKSPRESEQGHPRGLFPRLADDDVQRPDGLEMDATGSSGSLAGPARRGRLEQVLWAASGSEAIQKRYGGAGPRSDARHDPGHAPRFPR